MEQPAAIALRVGKTSKRNLVLVLLSIVVAGFAAKVILFGFAQPKRPTERELLQAFHENRGAFEELRDMFQADHAMKLHRVGTWGVETHKPFFHGKPTPADFPMERYQKYLDLLHRLGSTMAYKLDGGDPTVGVWQGGWFGNYKSIEISWRQQVPTNQVASLDQCNAPPPSGDRQLFYRHIDENWYFVTDMRPF